MHVCSVMESGILIDRRTNFKSKKHFKCAGISNVKHTHNLWTPFVKKKEIKNMALQSSLISIMRLTTSILLKCYTKALWIKKQCTVLFRGSDPCKLDPDPDLYSDPTHGKQPGFVKKHIPRFFLKIKNNIIREIITLVNKYLKGILSLNVHTESYPF